MIATSQNSPEPIATAADAERAIAHLNTIMDRLVETVQEETARVRGGKLREAVTLQDSKSELARSYVVATTRVKAAKTIVAQSLPQELDELRQRHEALQALLKTNMTVLATAHAVGEGIIRGVSGELVRKNAPSTYGASGRANAPSPKASQPLAVSRTL
ncbi:MAG TPA: hypothetical protein VI251_16760 [Pseudolabrys sp.]